MATSFRFDKPYDYEIRSPQGALRGTVSYPSGTTEKPIPEAHAEAAEKAGVGERVGEKAAAKAEDTKSAKRG